MLGNPSYRHFQKLVKTNQLHNCPILKQDIIAAEDIFGNSIVCLKGKTVRQPVTHARFELTKVPISILQKYQEVELVGDVMRVNKLRFFISKSRHIKIITSEHIHNSKENTLFSFMKKIEWLYRQRGFNVSTILLDGEFEFMELPLLNLGIALNMWSNNEHIREIKRMIRTVKEQARGTFNTLPFKKVPSRIIVELVLFCVFRLNSLYPSQSIVDGVSPRTIITGLTIDYNKHVKHNFGEYVQTHEEVDNSMQSCTVVAIALRPTSNVQGGHYYLSLHTRRCLNCATWTPLPMPTIVIDRVHQLAWSNPEGIEFRDRSNNIYDDDLENDD